MLRSVDPKYSTYVDELYPGYFLSRGMSGDDIKRLQQFLYQICTKYKSIPGVRVNGEFDELTEKSILKFQNDNGLQMSGLVGPFTWRKIVEVANQ